MEQFSLEKWLENPNRKVVTRSGNPVRIICTDRKHGEDELPIVFLEECHNGEFLLTCRKDGRSDTYDTPYDLFFAEEEEKEELDEFEKELQAIISEASHWTSDDGSISTYCQFGDKEIKKISAQVLDLARKEILKDLPKWKDVSGKNGAGTKDYKIVGYYLVKGNYAIYLEDLEKLPKEE